MIFLRIVYSIQPFTLQTIKALVLFCTIAVAINFIPGADGNPLYPLLLTLPTTILYLFCVIQLKISEEMVGLWNRLISEISNHK
jgi:hypothetical protein